MTRYVVSLKPGARDQLKTLDLQVRAALAEAILDLQFALPEGAEKDEVDTQRFAVYLPPVANGLRPYLVYRLVPPTNGAAPTRPTEVVVLTVAQYAAPAPAVLTDPASVSPTTPSLAPPKYLVYDTLIKFFNQEEIEGLVFDLGRDIPELDVDSLPRDTKDELARELVQFLSRRDQLDRLVTLIQARRPDIKEI